MRKYQFLVVEAHSAEGLASELNTKGSDGYRVVGYGTNGDSHRDRQKHWAIMERELPDDGSDIPTEA